jgi:hypothetical protein
MICLPHLSLPMHFSARKIGDQAFCAAGTWLRFVVCTGGCFAIRIRQFELFSGTGLSAAIRAGNAGR